MQPLLGSGATINVLHSALDAGNPVKLSAGVMPLAPAAESRDHAEDQAEPVLCVHLQRGRCSDCGGDSVSLVRTAAQPDHCRRRDEPEFRLGHHQCLATAESEAVIMR